MSVGRLADAGTHCERSLLLLQLVVHPFHRLEQTDAQRIEAGGIAGIQGKYADEFGGEIEYKKVKIVIILSPIPRYSENQPSMTS